MTTRRRRKAGRGPRTVALLAMIIALLTTAYVISNSSEEPVTTATATGPVTVPADSLVHQLEGFALGSAIEPEAQNSIEQNLLPLAGTTSPSEVIAALRFLEPLGDSTAIAFVVGPPRAKANIPFRRPSDCLGETDRIAGQPVCVTRLDDGSTLLRWGGSDVWLGVFTEQRSDFAPAVMSGLIKSSLAPR